LAGSRIALVVAVDQYDDDALRDLTAPAADADGLAEVLADPALGNFSVEVLHNESRAVVAERLEAFLSDLGPSDFALLHFSCHGLKDDSGELYLAAKNTKVTRLASTGIDAAFIDRLMRRSRSQQIVLFLDCCYGGAFQRGVIPRAGNSAEVGEQFHQEALGGGRGRVVITASTAMEYAFEGANLTDVSQATPSLFSGALVEGLRTGDADRDQDGRVSLRELYEYVYDAVRSRSPHQTPSKWEYGVQGDLVIARTPRRRIRPRDLPEDVLELVQHGHASVRLSAVTELGRMMEGDDLPLAVAAHTVLASLADDDSRRVCTAARQTLDASRLRLPVENHDFGRLGQGSTAPSFCVDLQGPPLVQAAEVTASSPRFRVLLDEQTLTVSPDTSTSGTLEARVTISSPVGSASLDVRAEVLSPVSVPQRPRDGALGTKIESTVPRDDSDPLERGGSVGRGASGVSVTVADAPGESGPVEREAPYTGIKLGRILVAVLLIIVVGVAIYSVPGSGGSGDGDDGRWGPLSAPFQMNSSWNLTVTSATEAVCRVEIYYSDQDPAVDSAIYSTLDHEPDAKADGTHTWSTRIGRTGEFALRWYGGDEDDCRAEVTQTARPGQTVSPP
jgi:uncharacterized caspase-like protein